MKRILEILTTFFYISLLVSCDSRPVNPKKEVVKSKSENNSEHRSKTEQDSLSDAQNAQIERLLGLARLDSGFADTQIRISFWYAWSDSCKYVIINKGGDSWNSFAYYCNLNIDSNMTLLSIDRKIEPKTPISGWDIFLDSIQMLGIYELKNYKKIPDYQFCTDSDVIYFEIAKNGKYQIFKYPWCSNKNENSASQAQNVVRILNFIQGQFGYRLFPRPKS